jgi:hypothetical protein
MAEAKAALARHKACENGVREAEADVAHLTRRRKCLRDLGELARQFERVGGEYVTEGVRESFGALASDTIATRERLKAAVCVHVDAIAREKEAQEALTAIVNAPAYRPLPAEILERIFRLSGNGNCRHVCREWRAAAHGSVPFMRQLFIKFPRTPTEWHPKILSRPFTTIVQDDVLTVGTSRGCVQRWDPHTRERDIRRSVVATHVRGITAMCATPQGLITVNSLGAFRSGAPICWEHKGVTTVVAAIVKGKTIYFVGHAKGHSIYSDDLSLILDGVEKPTCAAADGHMLAYALEQGCVCVADLRVGLDSAKRFLFDTKVTAIGWHLGLVIVGLVGPKLMAIVDGTPTCIHSGIVYPAKSNQAVYAREGVYDILSVKAEGTRHLYASVASRFVIFK